MGFLGKFSIVGLFLVLSAIQLEPVELATIIKDIGSAVVDFGVTFAPKTSQNLLKCVLKSVAIGMDAALQESIKENTEILLHHFDSKINGLEKILKNQSDSVLAELDGIRLDTKRSKLDEMIQELNRFTDYYNIQFVGCVEKGGCSRSTIEKYSEYWLNPHSSHRADLFNFVNKYILHTSVYSNDNNILELIPKIAERNHAGRRLEWTHHESVQNTIYTFYRYITGSLARMYRITLYFMVERYNNKIQADEKSRTLKEIENLITKFRSDFKGISDATKIALQRASRDIYPDDPSEYVKVKNYSPLSRFMVAYLRINHPINAAYIQWLKNNSPASLQDALSKADIGKCTHEYFWSTWKIWIDRNDNDRLYHHFNAEQPNQQRKMYGNEHKESQNLTFFDLEALQYDHRAGTAGKISTDLCYLDYSERDPTTVRKFSISAVTASDGCVVTGIRFQVYQGFVRIQIQEGKLVRGTIKPDTVRWKPVDTKNEEFVVLDYKKRDFNLDDIIVRHGFYLTGAQFYMNGNALSLRAYGMKITNDGQLIPGYLYDFATYNDASDRKEITLDKPDISINAPHDRQHKMQGTPGKSFIKFQQTDMMEDAGQTTIPFLDTQAIVTNPPTPLGGLGTYYKGMPGYGGFVGLKLISVDIASILYFENIDESFKDIEQQIIEGKNQLNNTIN